MTNIRLKGGKEIDLLAVNPKTGEKYHVEVRAPTSPAFALREKDTSKGRAYRRDLDYFSREKFNHPIVLDKIRELIGGSEYYKILVVWSTQDNFAKLPQIAEEKYDIQIWGLRGMIHDLIQQRITLGSRDDVLRIMELVSLVRKEESAFLKKTDLK